MDDVKGIFETIVNFLAGLFGAVDESGLRVVMLMIKKLLSFADNTEETEE